MATWTLGVLCREKALSELPNGSMVKNSSSCPGTQGDWLANKWKPAPTFRIGGLKKVLGTTFEREEVTILRWRMSKGCSSCVKAGSGTLGPKSIKWSSWMASSSDLGTSSIFMCQEVKGPLSLAWTVPEVNRAIRAIGEETPKGLDNGKGVGLAWVNRSVNCSPSCSKRISDDNNGSFYRRLGWRHLFSKSPEMGNWNSLHIPGRNHTCISGDYKCWWIRGGLMTKSVKGVELEFVSAPIGAVTGMERNMVRKVVQQPTSWAYLRVEWIKAFCKVKKWRFSIKKRAPQPSTLCISEKSKGLWIGMSTLRVVSTKKREKCMLGGKCSSPKTESLGQLLEMEMNRNEIYQSLNSTSWRSAKCT